MGRRLGKALRGRRDVPSDNVDAIDLTDGAEEREMDPSSTW